MANATARTPRASARLAVKPQQTGLLGLLPSRKALASCFLTPRLSVRGRTSKLTVAALEESLEGLSSLDVSYISYSASETSAGLAVSVGSAGPSLRHLDLSHMALGASNDRGAFAKALVNSLMRCPSLCTLNLAGNRLHDAGFEILLAALVPARMEGAEAAPPLVPALEELDLSWNSLRDGNQVARLLAGCSLSSLNLEANDLCDVALIALSAGLALNVQVRSLNIAHNKFGDDGLIALSNALRRQHAHAQDSTEDAPPLPRHALARWLLGLQCALAQGGSPPVAGPEFGMRQLDLSNNRIGDTGVVALAEALHGVGGALNLGLLSLTGTSCVSTRGRAALDMAVKTRQSSVEEFADKILSAIRGQGPVPAGCLPRLLVVQGLGLEAFGAGLAIRAGGWLESLEAAALAASGVASNEGCNGSDLPADTKKQDGLHAPSNEGCNGSDLPVDTKKQDVASDNVSRDGSECGTCDYDSDIAFDEPESEASMASRMYETPPSSHREIPEEDTFIIPEEDSPCCTTMGSEESELLGQREKETSQEVAALASLRIVQQQRGRLEEGTFFNPSPASSPEPEQEAEVEHTSADGFPGLCFFGRHMRTPSARRSCCSHIEDAIIAASGSAGLEEVSLESSTTGEAVEEAMHSPRYTAAEWHFPAVVATAVPRAASAPGTPAAQAIVHVVSAPAAPAASGSPTAVTAPAAATLTSSATQAQWSRVHMQDVASQAAGLAQRWAADPERPLTASVGSPMPPSPRETAPLTCEEAKDAARQLPVQQFSAQQLPAQQFQAQQLPAQQLPAQQLPAQQLPPQLLPALQLPAQQLPALQLPAQQLPAQQLPVQQLPAQQLPGQQLPAQFPPPTKGAGKGGKGVPPGKPPPPKAAAAEVAAASTPNPTSEGAGKAAGKGKAKGKGMPPPPSEHVKGGVEATRVQATEEGSAKASGPPPPAKGKGKGGKGGPPPPGAPPDGSAAAGAKGGKGKGGKGKGGPPASGAGPPKITRTTTTGHIGCAPFHRKIYWKPLDLADCEGTIFEDGPDTAKGSARVDTGALQRMFEGESAKLAAAAAKSSSLMKSVQGKAEGLKILSDNRARNVAIILRRLPVSTVDLARILSDLEWENEILRTDQLEQILDAIPTKEEADQLRPHAPEDARAKLRDVEQMVIPLTELRRGTARVRLICCARNAAVQVEAALGPLAVLRAACDAIHSSEMLRVVMLSALEIGNYINHGDSSTGAKAITIGSLLQLRDFKMGRMSSLHFLCAQLRLAGMCEDASEALQRELRPVMEAARFQIQGLSQAVRAFDTDVQMASTEHKNFRHEYDNGGMEEVDAVEEDDWQCPDNAVLIRGSARQRLALLASLTERLSKQLHSDVEHTATQVQATLRFCGVKASGKGEVPVDIETVLSQLAEFVRIFSQHWGDVNNDLARYSAFFTGPDAEGLQE